MSFEHKFIPNFHLREERLKRHRHSQRKGIRAASFFMRLRFLEGIMMRPSCFPLDMAIRAVDIGTSTWVPLECIHFHVKVPKTAKKDFWSSDLLRKGHSFLGQVLYKGPKCFFIGSFNEVGTVQFTRDLTSAHRCVVSRKQSVPPVYSADRCGGS
jgi:hypothetical protein